MIFDTHVHYDDEAFDADRKELLESLFANGIGTVVNNSASLESVTSSIELAHRYDFVYATVGVHPSEVRELNEEKMQWLKKMCEDPKVVAVGEIGLDYHYDDDPKPEEQIKWFRRQLSLAQELDMPVIIHSREAARDTFDIMKEAAEKGITADIHCYSYSPEQAAEYVKMGFFIGVGGVVTFKNARKLKETVKEIPIENIVLETDCPYLSPEPNRGSRNSSLNLPYVIETIAQIKEIPVQDVIDITEANARRLYRL